MIEFLIAGIVGLLVGVVIGFLVANGKKQALVTHKPCPPSRTWSGITKRSWPKRTSLAAMPLPPKRNVIRRLSRRSRFVLMKLWQRSARKSVRQQTIC